MTPRPEGLFWKVERSKEMIDMVTVTPYPVRVDASLQPHLSRWLWLVKWLLAIPHFIVLAFLWIAFAVLSVVAFFSILITGRYPRAIFDFNVGVLRWHWRVAYYSIYAFGTDRYPPFTLAEVPDYPAHLEITYPERLSRGLVLVKWWLLAIPHYLVVGLFVGGSWVAWQSDDAQYSWGFGLVGILAVIAAVVLAFTGRYPRSLFDFILGMDRWALRVAAYAALMTDKYPPFRLDMGGPEPAGTLTVPPHGPNLEQSSTAPVPPSAAPPGTGWTAGRIVSLVLGVLLGLAALGALGAGGAVLWADQTQRQDGYLTTDTTTFRTTGYALVSERIELSTGGSTWIEEDLIGDLRIRVTATDTSKPVFIGVAPADAVTSYLNGVAYSTINDPTGNVNTYIEHAGTAPSTAPTAAGIWTAQVTGTGQQSLAWSARDGDWMIVVMNADVSSGMTIQADAGATVPAVEWVEVVLFTTGVVLLAGAVLLVAIPVVRASQR
jgi:hypothetical protein